MRKPSKRAVELFVAGALALLGFRVLIGVPYYLFVSTPSLNVRLISSLLTALALPIGIAILLGRPSSVLCAQIYLWLVILSGWVVIPINYHLDAESSGRFLWKTVREVLVAAVLLALIFWSRSLT